MQFLSKFLIVVTLLVLGACAKSNVHYVDNKDVEITSVNSIEENGHIIVNATLSSSSSGVYHPVYKIKWLDKNENTIEETTWRPIIIKGGLPMQIKEMSTRPGVVDFLILISNDAR